MTKIFAIVAFAFFSATIASAQEAKAEWTIKLPAPDDHIAEKAQKIANQAAIGMLEAEKQARIAEAQLRITQANLEQARLEAQIKIAKNKPKAIKKDQDADREIRKGDAGVVLRCSAWLGGCAVNNGYYVTGGAGYYGGR